MGRNDIAPFFFNPKVRPPGVEEHVWVKQLAEIIEKVYLLGPGANDVFMESSHLATFKEMQDKVVNQKKKARELLWWASVKRTLKRHQLSRDWARWSTAARATTCQTY